MSNRIVLITALLAIGCGDDGPTGTADASAAADATTDAAADGAIEAFALTSAVLSDGGRFPDKHTCAGDNVSPPLSWTPAQTGTLSYAVVFTDTNNGLIHSVIWDIPSNVLTLPENVEKVFEPSVPLGAKQTRAYSPDVRGYLGPCPGSEHTYVFKLYAVDVATLPNVGVNSSRAEVEAELANHTLQTAELSGTWGPP